MNSRTRVQCVLAAILMLIVVGLSYWSGEQLAVANKEAGAARDATFKSFRGAQSMKALAAGYELTMNEFYSTVLEFPAYQKKSAEQKKLIDRELAALATQQDAGVATATALTRLYAEMDGFRGGLESAMTAPEKDWDRAREALFKLNVLSTQAIYQADLLGQSASERAVALDTQWQTYQSQSLLFSRIAMGLALLAALILLYSALRSARTGPGAAQD